MNAAPIAFEDGGYAYVPGVFQYSCGVVSLPGWRIERVRFSTPVPLARGFAHIEAFLEQQGRPKTALCACELHSPAPFSEGGFTAFNEQYVSVLERWGICRDGVNPVARSNTCPEANRPSEPSVYAFCYTSPFRDRAPCFVVAGSGEAPEGKANYRDHIVARGDISAAGLRAKSAWVIAEMERRMAMLNASWQTTTAVQLYTVHNVQPFLAEQLASRGAMRHGLTWHFNRPPVVEIEYEMDCRAVASEHLVAP